jgi:hypothetical protein
MVRVGLVSSLVGQIHGMEGGAETPTATSEEFLKKQKQTSNQTIAPSAAATSGSPTEHNELLKRVRTGASEDRWMVAPVCDE